jgi:hypothetical protein
MAKERDRKRRERERERENAFLRACLSGVGVVLCEFGTTTLPLLLQEA